MTGPFCVVQGDSPFAKAAARALPSAMTSSADLNSASLKNSLYRNAQSAALWQTSRSGSSS